MRTTGASAKSAQDAHSPGTAATLSELTADEATALAAVAELVNTDPVDHPEWFCHQARALARALPDPIRARLLEFAAVGSESGILVLRGLQVGGIPPTPPNNTLALGARTVFAAQVSLLSHVLGDMVSYQAEGCGYLIQDMVPNPVLAETQQSQGSKSMLEAHTEQCFSELRPDYLFLGCLRGDSHAATYAFSARELMKRLAPAEISVLRQTLWTTRIDASFAPFMPNPKELRGPFAIFSGDANDPTMLVDQDLMRGTTPQAQALLEKVVAIYETSRSSHTLEPGDVLFLDNNRAMHGRSSFDPRFDGTDRFIVRGFVVTDLQRSAHARVGRAHQIGARYS